MRQIDESFVVVWYYNSQQDSNPFKGNPLSKTNFGDTLRLSSHSWGFLTACWYLYPSSSGSFQDFQNWKPSLRITPHKWKWHNRIIGHSFSRGSWAGLQLSVLTARNECVNAWSSYWWRFRTCICWKRLYCRCNQWLALFSYTRITVFNH